MEFVFVVMLVMIAGSIVIEMLLPASTKQLLGTAICWFLMFLTMATLAAAAVGLVVVTWMNVVQPLLTS